MTRLRALIVDDEPLARERLRGMVLAESSVELVGECGSGTDAIATIRSIPLDVVFLDMQMPGCDGLQVLAALPRENRPAIVFVTAHERYAINAFEVQAIDYLLKPFDRERFRTAIQRAQEFHRARGLETAEQPAEELPADSRSTEKRPERLTVKADGRLVFLKPDDIVWVEADDNHVVLHLITGLGRLILRETMAALGARLGSAKFARVSRSAIVHLDQIRELQPTFGGDFTVLLKDGTKLPLTRGFREQLIKYAGAGEG